MRRRVRAGNLVWLGPAAGAEALSYAGYVVLLRAVVGWCQSFLITMAGAAVRACPVRFDIAALAAAFHAFGAECGMIGAPFGEPAGAALVAVLAYRLVSFWLPTVIGAPAYLALVRSPRGRTARRGSTTPGAGRRVAPRPTTAVPPRRSMEP